MSSPAIDDVPFQRFHGKLIAGAAAGYISDGYTLGVVGIALAAAQPQLHLTPQSLGALGGASLAGLFVGALASGPLADRIGRRPIFAYNMLVFVALSLLQFWVGSAAQLLVVRFLLGLILGSDYVVCKALLIECVPPQTRGRALSLMGVAWAVGYALAYVAGLALQTTRPDAWRWILASGAVPCLISLPLRLSAPESTPWLRQSVRRSGKVSGWSQLFGKAHLRSTLVASTLFFCLVVPYFAVSTFIPQVMAALHVHGNEMAALIYILGLMVGSIGGFLLVDALPRRTFVIGSFAITTVALLISTFLSGLMEAPVIVAFAVYSFVLSAAQAQVYVYLPELFPTAIRASGLGVAVAASRIGAAAGTSLLPLCVVYFGVHAALYVCAAILAIGGVTCFVWAPETRALR